MPVSCTCEPSHCGMVAQPTPCRKMVSLVPWFASLFATPIGELRGLIGNEAMAGEHTIRLEETTATPASPS